ncbi:hypothetical protein [Reyranella sp.]|uniref:hypothetical protein n=1 Tax=Reyranella sp. TaxID=1929291 RepID=UPI003BAA05D4
MEDKLIEIGAHLRGMIAEADALKMELEAAPGPDVKRLSIIRRRRSYIARRNAELKAERQVATLKRNKLIAQLDAESVE